jgi:hypothetical protein
MKILKASDRVKVKIGEITFLLAPMKMAQKLEINSLTRVVNGQEVNDGQAMLAFIVKHCVKGIEGVTDYEGNPIQVQIDETGCLVDDSISDTLSILNESKNHINALLAMSKGTDPAKIKDYATGKTITGVEVTINPKT